MPSGRPSRESPNGTEFAGNPTIFANTSAICFTCASHTWPYIAKQMKVSKVGVLAYGIAQHVSGWE